MNLSREVSDSIVTMVKNFRDYNYYEEKYNVSTAKEIGKGGFGIVYEVTANGEAGNFAVKEVEIGYEMDYSDGSVTYTSDTDNKCILDFVQCCQEAVLQSDVFKHPNIVHVHDKWIQNGIRRSEETAISAPELLTIMEFLESNSKRGADRLEITAGVREALLHVKGLCVYMAMEVYDKSLKKWLEEDEGRSRAGEEITRQLVGALTHIHQKQYIHRDLTPANILIKENVGTQGVEAAITDCGLTQLHITGTALDRSNREGVPPYNSAPDTHLTDKFDMWSLGFIIYGLLRPEATRAELSELYQRTKESAEKTARFIETNLQCPTEDEHLKAIVTRCLQSAERRASSAQLDLDLTSNLPPTFDDLLNDL